MNSAPNPQRRSFWLKHLHQWHWISAAVCLIGMLLFAGTGITLNHASQIEAKPVVASRTGTLPDALRAAVESAAADEAKLSGPLSAWLQAELGADVEGRLVEWSDEEAYVSLPRPGGDAWLTIDRESGDVHYELTRRGWVSYFNDLHKGRNTGAAWSGFLDVFAIACVVFCVTGLILLQFHSRARPATWPVVALGVVIPLVLALLFIH